MNQESNLPLNPKSEMFRWGPVPLRYFYQSDFNRVITDGTYEAVFAEYMWPTSVTLYLDDRVSWVNEFPALCTAGEHAFNDLILPLLKRAEIFNNWEAKVARHVEVEHIIDSTDLSGIDENRLKELWTMIHKSFEDAIVFGLVPELANCGADALLERELKRYISNRQDIISVMEVLTAPTKLSFYQQEEVELAETVDIALHQKKYFWLQNSYASVRVLPVEYFRDRKAILSGTLRADIEARLSKVREDKVAVQKKFGLPEEIMNIAEGIAYCIVWQDDRKAFILKALHYKDVLLNEIVRRSSLAKDNLLDFSCIEILELWEGKRPASQMAERRKGFGQIITNFIVELSSEQTRKYWDIYAEESMGGDLREVRGIVASKGDSIKGRVKILLDPREADAFPDGAVLVAPMTSPEYIFAMRKSSAIVTDNGGLTSHAAIVSRELHKPCVIGTKFATRVFKDGDMVEVDTKRGIVTLLE